MALHLHQHPTQTTERALKSRTPQIVAFTTLGLLRKPLKGSTVVDAPRGLGTANSMQDALSYTRCTLELEYPQFSFWRFVGSFGGSPKIGVPLIYPKILFHPSKGTSKRVPLFSEAPLISRAISTLSGAIRKT